MEKETERSIEWLVEEIMRGSSGENRNMEEKELVKRGEFRKRTERLVRNLMLRELEKAREEGRREALETLHLKLNDCTDIMAKIEKIIDHLNSQAQPEENEEWEKRFIRTFGYWGEEIKFIKQLLKEREREVLEDIKGVNNEIYEGRTEILEVEIDNRLDKLNKEEE